MAIVRNESEDIWHDKVEELIKPYFHVKHDTITGKHWTGIKVRPDFIILPRQELVDAGVPKKLFGIEVKSGDLDDGHKKQAIEATAQAISYMESKYKVGNNNYNLEAVFIYPPISVHSENSSHQSYPDFLRGFQYGLSRLAGRFGVGEIVEEKWRLAFYIADTIYLSIYKDGRIQKGNVPLGGKIQIGCKLQKRP